MRYLKSSGFFVALTILVLSFQTVNAQTSWCGQVEMEQRYLDEHPEKVAEIEALREQMNQEALAAESQRGPRAIKVIPVVFHVLHLNGPENISDAQIMDQMRIMNEDYNKGNADLSDVVSSFVNVIGDVGIEFRLAKIDPNGNATDGIDRVYSSKTNSGGESAKINYWDRSMYLNVWVIKNWDSSIPSSVLAYSRTPSGAHNIPTKDGVIIKSQYVGSIGTGNPVYARTLTHEVGHYLNLSHTWGSSNNPGMSTNCNSDDGVSDTPNCIGTYSCNTSAQSCGSLDMIQNHMDYADCTVMFTEKQGVRMISALNSGTAQRSNLSTPGNLTATGVNQLTVANFSANKLTICQYETVDFSDLSEYDASAWNWTFQNAQTNTSNTENPQITYSQPGVFDVNLSASNGTNTVSESKVGYIMVNPMLGNFAPFAEDFSSVSQLNHENWYGVNDNNDAYEFVADPVNGFSASPCLRIENFGNESGSKDELRSTTFDLRLFSSVTVAFKVAYAQKASSDISKLTLYVSNDCGNSWSPRWSASGSSMSIAANSSTYYTPAGNQDWKPYSVNIPSSLLAQTSQFKFVFENNNGNNLYFDDFNITGAYQDVAQLKYPLNGMTSTPSNQVIYWKAMGGGVDSYEYQIDSDPTFTSGNLQTGINPYIAITDGLDTEFTPAGLVNGQQYFWRVRLIIGGVTKSWSSTWSFTVAANGVSTEDILRAKYQVKVYPNPMRTNGYLSFNMPKGENVQLTINDVLGKSNRVLADSFYSEGTHLFNLSELKLTPGMYVLNMRIGSESIYQKFIVH
jgi:PKD repeat protein